MGGAESPPSTENPSGFWCGAIPQFSSKILRKKEIVMNDKIKTLLNEQINKELYSAYLYIDIANYYDELDLDGYANY